MATTLKVYANDDDVLLFWDVPSVIPGCRGFAINRRTTDASGTEHVEPLPNRVGFASTTPPVPGTLSQTEPSTVWPFQRFSWTDYGAKKAGGTVAYQVVPIVRDATGALVTVDDQASDWSAARTLVAPDGTRFRPFFNRGFVISQFMARYLAEKHLTAKQFKDGIQSADEVAIRTFLSGDLRLALLDQLRSAAEGTDEVYAALFELADDELVDALTTLGPRAHVVLSNGSISANKGESTTTARQRDENADARAKLIAASVDVGVHDRFVAPKPLGHNKFMVRTDHAGTPQVAWTGSTNWTPTGLCTQLNNGLLVDDPAIAKVYLDQWHRLRDAASAFPASLVTANSSPHPGGTAAGSTATVWFSRTHQEVDLAAMKSVIDGATQGILFLMFMPGPTGVLSYVQARVNDPGLYVRGVVSELPNGANDASKLDLSLVNGAQVNQASLDIIQPEGIANPFANFAAEVTHKQFLSQIGYAIVHSKVLVIDPFSDNATVITGSHNFSTSASTNNDENFIVINGDRALAEAYAVNIVAAYDHYRWRAFLTQDPSPFNGLQDDDTWMAPKLAASAPDFAFFGLG